MATSSGTVDHRARRAFAIVAVTVLVLFVALTLAWYVLAGRLDAAVRQGIDAAAGRGARIACDGQEVFGYPFRLGLRCGALAVEVPDRGVRASAGALRTAAQVYDPTRLVAELDGPLLVQTPDAPPLDLRWRLAQASAHFWTDGLDRLSLVVEAPVVALAEPAGASRPVAASDHVELHARRNGADLDLAFTDRGVTALEPAYAALPPFDVSGDVSVAGAADWLSGRRPGATLGEALRGRSGTIRSLAAATATPGGGGASLSGPFSVGETGLLSGTFDLVVSEPQALAALVGRFVPGAGTVAATAAAGIGFMGRTENGRTTIRLSVAEGRASLGMIAFKIPPLK